jgi:hypothetical protein
MEKVNQERRPFLKVDDSFKKVIIVRNNIKPRKDEYGVITISIKDFLLNQNILKEI